MATLTRTTGQRPKTASSTKTATTTITMKSFDTTRSTMSLLSPVPRRNKAPKSTTKAERRRSMPVAPMAGAVGGPFSSASSQMALSPSSASVYDRPQTSGVLSPPLTPRSPRSFRSELQQQHQQENDISFDRLRSNSGLSLHTNNAALRRYTDYNMDGSSRLPPTEELSVLEEHVDPYDIRSMSPSSTDGVAGLYSRETVNAVLQDARARKQLRDFASREGGVETLDFLDKVEEYCNAVQGVTALMATISTTFTSLTATQPLNLPPSLSKALNADIKHVSSSILPGLQMLFGEAGSHIEQRIVRDIYPAFVQRQLSMSMKTSLGATSAGAAQTPFRFAGLGHAFCLTDPYRPGNPIVYASDSFAHVTGYARAEEVPRNGRLLRGPLPGEEEEFTDEVVLNSSRHDNQPYWSLVSVCPLKSASGRVRFVLSGLVNVSDAVKSRDDTLYALGTAPPGPASPISVSGGSVCGSSSAGSITSSSAYPPAAPSSAMSSSSASISVRPPSISSEATSVSGNGKASRMSRSFLKPFSRKRRDASASRNGYESETSRFEPVSPTPGFHRFPDEMFRVDPAPAVSPSLRPNTESLPVYSRFMVLQFVPGSSYGAEGAAPAPPPISRRGSRQGTASATSPTGNGPASSRLKVAFCSQQMLELLGLGPAAHDAVLYHDVFSVLSELAGSPSITPIFRNAVRQRLAASEPASMEMSVPANSSSAPGAFSAGLGISTPMPMDVASRRSSMFASGRSRSEQDDDVDSYMEDEYAVKSSRRRSITFERPPTMDRRVREGPKMQRLMSHWTPLKDVDGSIAWIMLVISPVVER